MTTRLLPVAAAAMGVTGIALLGSFGLEHCSSGFIHVYDQGCGIGLIQYYATNVLGASSNPPCSHPPNSSFIGVCLCCCPALSVAGEPLMGAQVKLEMQHAHDYVGSVGRDGYFTGLEVVQPICPYIGSTGMPILMRVVNSQSQ